MNMITSAELLQPRLDGSLRPTNDVGWHTFTKEDGTPHSIYGYMGSNAQKEFIYRLGYGTLGCGLEIGSFQGLSAVVAALGMKHAGHIHSRIHCIDPFTTFNEHTNLFDRFMANVEAMQVTQHIIPHRMSSVEAAQEVSEELSWLYIDGRHTPEGTIEDGRIYIPMVAPEGTIIFHDTDQEGVQEGIAVLADSFKLTRQLALDDFEVWRTTARHRRR